MKSLRLLFAFIIMASLFSCDDPLDFDTLAATDFPPGILDITPGGKQLAGDFDIVVQFADGSVSPLQTATVTLTEVGGSQITEKTESLSGTTGELRIPGSEFGAADLPVGTTYRIDISVTDTKNQTTTVSSEFEISLLPFDANHNGMWVSGAFNGWAADEGVDRMTLIADNIWEIQEIDLQGQPWKIKNTFDWSDEDWGDGDCDRRMTSNQADGGNSDTDCGISGLINLRFNDATLTYSWEPAVTFESNATGMYLLGEFNNFEGEGYAMTQTADYTWEIQEVELEEGVEFKFAESPDFMGKNWGDADNDGRAEEFGPNIVFQEQTAFYNITFNDRTLQYEFEFVRFPSIGIIGSATPGGWDTDTDMNDNGDGTFSLLIDLIDGEAKFRANNDWAVNWGATDFPSGVGTLDGPNIPVTAGKYNITFNPSTGEYNFEEDLGFESVGLIGDATPNGWGEPDFNMRDLGDGLYEVVMGLADGTVKFRANDRWDVADWGGTDFPSGTGVGGGDNIPVTAGIYRITLNSNTGEYNFEPTTIGIIGDATPGGWDNDTDMTPTGADPGEVSVTLTLTDGAAKFRAFNDWPWNWGSGDFPSGVGTQDGDNIPVTAGTYTIKLNVNTGAYSFE